MVIRFELKSLVAQLVERQTDNLLVGGSNPPKTNMPEEFLEEKEWEEEFIYQKRKLALLKNPGIYGVSILFKGRLKGVSRARSVRSHFGTVGPNTYQKRVKGDSQPIKTKWGIWNLKVNLYRPIT